MGTCKIIQNPEAFKLPSKWQEILPSKKGNIVTSDGKEIPENFKGARYKVLCEAENTLVERIKRLVQGILRVIFTCGLAYARLDKVKSLFTNKHRIYITPIVPYEDEREKVENPADPEVIHPSEEKDREKANRIVNDLGIQNLIPEKQASIKQDLDGKQPIAEEPIIQAVIPNPPLDQVENEKDVNPKDDIEKAREEFLEWFGKDGSKLGEGDYEQQLARLKQLSQDLPREDLTLHYDLFRWGISLFYGEKPGRQKFVPLHADEGIILKWLTRKGIENNWWPIKDPQTNTYFIPKITLSEVQGSHSGSDNTGNYLYHVFRYAQMDRNSEHYRLLEGLASPFYAKFIQKEFGNDKYMQLRELVPSYPDLPPLPETQPTFWF